MKLVLLEASGCYAKSGCGSRVVPRWCSMAHAHKLFHTIRQVVQLHIVIMLWFTISNRVPRHHAYNILPAFFSITIILNNY